MIKLYYYVNTGFSSYLVNDWKNGQSLVEPVFLVKFSNDNNTGISNYKHKYRGV